MFKRRDWLKATAMTVAMALCAFAVPSQAQNKLKVAAIYTVPVEQQWVSRIHKALNAAKDRGEIEYVFSEKVANADYERVMREYAEKGNTLVVGESFAVEAAARKVAKDYPKVSFLMGSSGKPQVPNFSVFDNYIQEPAYLSGMVAGGMTKTNRIGMVGGYPIPEVNRLMHAFMAGAKETNPKVEFYVTFIGSWFDPPKAKEAAYAMIEKGADVLYAERFGVSDTAKEKGKLAIGNVINTQPQYPDTVVASALWNMEPTIDRAIKAAKDGKLKAEDYGSYSMMKHKGSELAPLGTERQSFPAQARGSDKAAGEAALVQMSLMVARAINALRKKHPEVMKEAKPPPLPALQSPPQVKAAAPAPAAKPPPPAEPARPQGSSLFSRATSWLSRSIPAAAEKIRGTISEKLPSSKTVTSLTARFAGAAALSVGLAATFRADTSHEGPQAVTTPVPAPVMAKAAPLSPAPKLVAAAPAVPFSAPVPAVRETAEPSAKSAAQPRRTYRMDDLFHQEDALEEALDKLEQMPVDEAFGKAVLVESGDRQHDAGGRVVTSHKGATGAAQVLPSTAKIIAIGCTGKPLDQDRFRNDKSYNKSLGPCWVILGARR